MLEVESLDDREFRIGEMFDSFEAISERLNCYCKKAFVHYWTRDSRKINASSSKARHVKNSRLKYYSLRYTCVLGGQEHRSRGSGKRYSLSIRATNCPAFISFRLTKDGQHLEVSAVNNEHNHEQSEESFRALPKERKLPDEIKADILDLIQLQVDRGRVMQYVRFVTQKVITTKDLANLSNSGQLQNRPEITAARSRELLEKISHHEEANMPNHLEIEPEAQLNLRVIAPKVKKRGRGNNLLIPECLKENDTNECTSVYVCKVPEPETEIVLEHSQRDNDQPSEELPTSSSVEQEDRINIDDFCDVVEDSEHFCITCGQSFPQNLC